jgi:hypothetical protein
LAGSILDRIGIAKAAVFPVPVWARPTTSEPAIIAGMMAAWIADGFSYPTSPTACSTDGCICRSAKVSSAAVESGSEDIISGEV